MHEEAQSDERSPLDFIHYGICFAGFVLGVGGVVISSIICGLAGLALMFIALAYFAASAVWED